MSVYEETKEDDGEAIPELEIRRRSKKRKNQSKAKLYRTTS